MKEGIALGVGSSIGHRIVSAVSGEPTLRVGMMTSQAEKPLPTVKGDTLRVGSPEAALTQEYEQCMKEYDDKSVCTAKYLS